jgi:oligoribonuclease NrnB/cAMP/cGMP phosphodiesterase (DHH superfamily)
MKTKLFTHTDFDGVGCYIVACHIYGKENVDVTYCDYKEVDEKVLRFVTDGKFNDYDQVYITDISVDAEVADLINEIALNKFMLIDHHPTAEWMNEKYDWCYVQPIIGTQPMYSDFQHKTSGTSLFFEHLRRAGLVKSIMLDQRLGDFAENVRRYDSWEWDTFYKDEHPKRLNNLLYLTDKEYFVNRFMNNLNVNFTENEELILKLEEDKIKNYIKRVSCNIRRVTIQGYNAGVVFAESYASELGNVLAKENTDLDFIAIIKPDNGTVSYRGVKDGIDLGQVAKIYDGGGHPRASGSSIKNELINEFIEKIFYKGGI